LKVNSRFLLSDQNNLGIINDRGNAGLLPIAQALL